MYNWTVIIKKQFSQRLIEESLHRINICLDELSEDQIWYRHNANCNPVGNLILHLSGNIRQYIISGLGEEADRRNRVDEFSSKVRLSKDELKGRIRETIISANDVVQSLPEDAFGRGLSIQGFEHTGLSVIIHVIEHLSYHVGQITYFTKWIKDIDTSYYGNLDLNITGN